MWIWASGCKFTLFCCEATFVVHLRSFKCKFSGLKLWLCKKSDKYEVCHHHMLNEHCSLYAHLIIIIISSYYHHHHNKLISSSSLDDLQEHQLASCWLSGPTQTRFGQSAGSSPRGQFVWKVVESWSNLVRHPIQVGKLGKCFHL